MDNIFQSVLDDICDKLKDKVGLDCFGSDLHHYLCNQDYFIIGSYSSKKFLGEHAFEAIEMVKNYEQSNFGEVTTDLSQPELVVNMVSYIVGEYILAESDYLQACQMKRLSEIDLQEILSDVGGINTLKLYNEAA
jgi:ribosomal silencing factor RsfS